MVNEFLKVPISFFYEAEKALVDIFIYLEKREGGKYILRYPKDENIEIDELKTYVAKGVDYLFIREGDRDTLYGTLSNSVCYEMAVKGCKQSMNKGLELAQGLFEGGGYSPASIQLIEELNIGLFSRLEEEAKGSDKGSVIKNILDSKDSLYFKKISLQTILGMDILKTEEWAKPMHYELYNFMSIFADIALTKGEMLLVSVEEDLDESNFTEKELHVLNNHAHIAFSLLDQYPSKPINVDLLILEHHGMKSGIGFSKNVSASLNKLVVIYRVAENIAIEMLKKERDKQSFTIEEIYGLVDKKFESPRVQSVLKKVA